MSNPLAQTTILDPFPSSSSASDAPAPPSVESISLLPFSINYDGPAPISTYFHPSPVPSTSAAVAEGETTLLQQEAAFRGRLLVSKRVALPEGYTGLVFSTSQPVAAAAPLAPTTPSKRAGTAPKRVKVDAAAERKAAAERAKGLRRSPRKRVVKKEVKKFMLDSDDDEDQENEPVAAQAPKEEEQDEKVKMVVEETVVVEEETFIPEAPRFTAPAHKESTPEPETPIAEAPTAEAEDDDLPLARDERHLVPVLTFNSIDIWHPDYAGDLADDVYARTMSEWVGVSAKIHAY